MSFRENLYQQFRIYWMIGCQWASFHIRWDTESCSAILMNFDCSLSTIKILHLPRPIVDPISEYKLSLDVSISVITSIYFFCLSLLQMMYYKYYDWLSSYFYPLLTVYILSKIYLFLIHFSSNDIMYFLSINIMKYNLNSKTRWTIKTYRSYYYQPDIFLIIAWNKWWRCRKHILWSFHSVTSNRIRKNKFLPAYWSCKRKRKCK